MSFWAEQVQSTDIGYDRDIAEGFRRQASAKLLAVEAYPAYTFLAPLYGAFACLVFAFSLGATLGAIYPSPVSADALSAQEPIAPLLGVIGPVFMSTSIFGMAVAVESRRQVASKYLTAQVIERGKKISVGENGQVTLKDVREPLLMPWSRVLGVIAFSLGVFVLVVNVIFMLRIGFDVLGEMTPLGGSIFYGSAVGALLLTVVGAFVVSEFFIQADAEWRHPIMLSAEASATRPSTSESQAAIPDGAAGANQAEEPWWQRLLRGVHGSRPEMSAGRHHL